MNIDQLLTYTAKPKPYTPGTASIWVNEHISAQLLDIHLDQNTDLASRKKTTIASTIDWILKKKAGDRLKILDLGCGPGLYAEEFARRGHVVTGMDFSAHSVCYAKNSAQKNKLNINYIRKDYLELSAVDSFDLVLMIYTDFGVLTPEQRKHLLANVIQALKPGGVFIFDVLNNRFKKENSRDWELKEKGFWRNSPYLVISESSFYEEENVTLNQHIVVDAHETVDVYRFWIHTYSHDDLAAICSSAGFKTVNCYEEVVPGSEMYNADSVTFCITLK